MFEEHSWSWVDNPFVGTQPFDGLLVVLLVFNSWDLKETNNRIYEVERGGRVEQWYVVRDLGGALGEDTGISPKRNDLERFERTRFIQGLSGGFVKFVYAQLGLTLPHYAATQFARTPHIDPMELQAGDLVFFEPRADGPGHVGIYIGGGLQINAPTEGQVVSIQPVFSGFWGAHFDSGGRVQHA